MARGRGRGAGLRREALQDRQREGGGLAGAGLRARHQVAPGEDQRDRLLLHRRRLLVAEVGHRSAERLDQAKLVKCTQFKVRAGRSPASAPSVPGSLSSISQSLFFTAACSSRQTECRSTESKESVMPCPSAGCSATTRWPLRSCPAWIAASSNGASPSGRVDSPAS